MAVHQSRCDRQFDAGLADVVRRIGEELRAAFVELLPGRLGPDRNTVTARFTDRLHHQLGEMVESVAQRLRLAADMRLDIVQYWLFSKVIADYAGHVGVDRLVVSDACP